MRLGTVIPYLGKMQRNNNQLTHALSSAILLSLFFHRKLEIIIILENTDKSFNLINNFYFFTFINPLKVVLKNMIAMLMMSSELVNRPR